MALNRRTLQISNRLYYAAIAAFLIGFAISFFENDTVYYAALFIGIAFLISGFIMMSRRA